jgi:hypothetical protein
MVWGQSSRPDLDAEMMVVMIMITVAVVVSP